MEAIDDGAFQGFVINPWRKSQCAEHVGRWWDHAYESLSNFISYLPAYTSMGSRASEPVRTSELLRYARANVASPIAAILDPKCLLHGSVKIMYCENVGQEPEPSNMLCCAYMGFGLPPGACLGENCAYHHDLSKAVHNESLSVLVGFPPELNTVGQSVQNQDLCLVHGYRKGDVAIAKGRAEYWLRELELYNLECMQESILAYRSLLGRWSALKGDTKTVREIMLYLTGCMKETRVERATNLNMLQDQIVFEPLCKRLCERYGKSYVFHPKMNQQAPAFILHCTVPEITNQSDVQKMLTKFTPTLSPTATYPVFQPGDHTALDRLELVDLGGASMSPEAFPLPEGCDADSLVAAGGPHFGGKFPTPPTSYATVRVALLSGSLQRKLKAADPKLAAGTGTEWHAWGLTREDAAEIWQHSRNGSGKQYNRPDLLSLGEMLRHVIRS